MTTMKRARAGPTTQQDTRKAYSPKDARPDGVGNSTKLLEIGTINAPS